MNRFLGWLAAVIVLALWACEKTDDLRDEIGSLSDRLAVLESRIGDVNADIVALHRLMDPSTVVVGVTPTSTGYELALSDGTVCRVTLGEQLGTLVPLLGIDAEGYWTVSFDNGATSERLEAGGGYVSAWPRTDGSPAENASGVTPQLRVDDDGNWLVSLDGSTFELRCRTENLSVLWAATTGRVIVRSSSRWFTIPRAENSISNSFRVSPFRWPCAIPSL